MDPNISNGTRPSYDWHSAKAVAYIDLTVVFPSSPSYTGLLSVWVSTMPPVWLLSLLQQFHCHTAGFLLLLAVGDHGVCHHDPAWNGDSASKSKIMAGLNTLCFLGLCCTLKIS